MVGGPRPGIVGNGNDLSAQANAGFILSATGSFDSVTNALSEADGGTANRFSLQLNTDFFSSPACSGAASPSSCRGWEQFIYSNTGVAFIQYWLINWDTTCPSSWNTAGGDCWKNAPTGVAYPVQPLANLQGLHVNGTANFENGTDTVTIAGPNGTASASNVDDVLSLSKDWQAAEFNVIGDCCASRADFSSGVTIVVRTTVNAGLAISGPACAHEGFTGETNDLNLGTVCSAVSPAIVFSESNPPGSIWKFNGTACTGTSCPGWTKLDSNNLGVRIAATGSSLYELWNTGNIWQFKGTACTGASCPGWKMLDDNPTALEIVAGGGQLYQLHNTGEIWRYTGTPCSGISCPGWQKLDDNPAAVTIAAASGGLYQLHNNGKIWKYTGVPCSGTSCPGWEMLDDNPAAVAITTGAADLYQLHNDGKVFQYTGVPCSGTSCPGWKLLNDNPNALTIVAGSTRLYELDTNGTIWEYTGTPCSGLTCPGWRKLDDNPAALNIASDGANVYELHNNGRLWKFTGTACTGSSCPGWKMIDDNAWTGRIAATNGILYQVHVVDVPPERALICYECR